MKSADRTATHVICLINKIVLGKEAKSYTGLVERYLVKNGKDWTVDRLKAVYNAALHLKNGDKVKAIDVLRNNSIAYTKAGYPKDPRLALPSRRFVEAKKPSLIKRWAAVLRGYTAITHSLGGGITFKQCKGVVRNISSPSIASTEVEKLYRNIVRVGLGGRYDTSLYLNGSKNPARSLKMFTGCYTPVSPKGIPSEVRAKPYFNAIYSMMNTSFIPEGLAKNQYLPSFEIALRNQDMWEKDGDPRASKRNTAGKIYVIQEGGCKARAVAIPNAWVQTSFVTLHKALAHFTDKHFSLYSCVTDQTKGASIVARHMEKGLPVFSVDLSAATDRFPLSFQLELLKQLGLTDFETALESVVNAEWDFPQGAKFGSPTVKYSVGQPMGLYGSFPLFNLAHIVLAKSLVQKDTVLFPDGSPFKVVGDDIVMADEDLSDRYTFLLTEMGVEVSPLKTFKGTVAQFAGFNFVPAHTTSGVLAFRPYKFPGEEFISNPINLLDALGNSVTKMRREAYWNRVFTLYQSTTGQRNIDLSPILNSTEDSIGVDGSLTLHRVVELRDHIIRFDTQKYLGKDDWACSLPLVNEWSTSNLVSNIAPLATKDVQEDRRFHLSRRVFQDPLMSRARSQSVQDNFQAMLDERSQGDQKERSFEDHLVDKEESRPAEPVDRPRF